MTTFSDDFNRANENPLAGNWTTQGSGGVWSDLQLSGNAIGSSTSSTGCSAYVNSITPGADQFAQCAMTPAAASGCTGGGPCVRMATGAGTFYGLQLFGGSNPLTLDLYKEIGTTYTSLAQVSYTYTVGDVLRLEVQGATLRAFVNGVLKASALDTSIASGRVGMVSFVDATIKFDNFSGGDNTMAVATASDDFNRADENPVAGSAGWIAVAGTLKVVSNHLEGHTGAENAAAVGLAPQAAQFAQVTVSGGDPANGGGGAMVRIQPGGTIAGYGVQTYTTPPNVVVIFKYTVGGGYSELASTTSSFTAGDVLRIEANGSALVAKKNGAQILTASDADFATGRVGAFIYNTGANAQLDDFSGGDLSLSVAMTAFQPGAFQSRAFQIFGGTDAAGGAPAIIPESLYPEPFGLGSGIGAAL